MNTMKWLVKREYWENRGGFFWAPAIVGGIATLFGAVAALTGSYVISKHHDEMHFDGNLLDHTRQLGGLGDLLLMIGTGLTALVLAFVLFFYVLSSLYDDRRDRSILFWKSMPVSDVQMVLSKAAWAFILAPVIALGIGLALGFVFWLIAAVMLLVSGAPGASAIFLSSHPFRFVAGLALSMPVQILWSLPAVGWLMLCSSWSRRVPFLWATAVPFLTCVMISFTDVFPGVEIPHGKIWYTVVYRGLASIVPFSWLPTLPDRIGEFNGPEDFSKMIDLTGSWHVLANADVWIGAVAGVAMILAAIRLRRWRDEG